MNQNGKIISSIWGDGDGDIGFINMLWQEDPEEALDQMTEQRPYGDGFHFGYGHGDGDGQGCGFGDVWQGFNGSGYGRGDLACVL